MGKQARCAVWPHALSLPGKPTPPPDSPTARWTSKRPAKLPPVFARAARERRARRSAAYRSLASRRRHSCFSRPAHTHRTHALRRDHAPALASTWRTGCVALPGHRGRQQRKVQAYATMVEPTAEARLLDVLLEALEQPGVDIVEVTVCQSEVPVVVGELGLDAGDVTREPFAMGKGNKAVLAAVQ
jgi:hypothetical protein